MPALQTTDGKPCFAFGTGDLSFVVSLRSDIPGGWMYISREAAGPVGRTIDTPLRREDVVCVLGFGTVESLDVFAKNLAELRSFMVRASSQPGADPANPPGD